MWRFEKVLLLITFVVLGIFGKAALAADPIERAIVACEYELTHFCSTVTPGEGRLMMCLGAHEDKISLGCAIAVYDAAVAIDALAGLIAAIGTACEQEIVDHCATPASDTEIVVEVGQGQVVACLAAHQAKLGNACKAIIGKLLSD
jgi:Golgi apparatus protein 1|tara:strand:+ start:571 stop:1008 length:438 start_codon:yes stop_codon:yes gene_type:complete